MWEIIQTVFFSLLAYNDHWYENVSTIKIHRAFLKPTHKVECIKFSFVQVMVGWVENLDLGTLFHSLQNLAFTCIPRKVVSIWSDICIWHSTPFLILIRLVSWEILREWLIKSPLCRLYLKGHRAPSTACITWRPYMRTELYRKYKVSIEEEFKTRIETTEKQISDHPEERELTVDRVQSHL